MNHLSSIPSYLRLLISGGDVLRSVYVDHLLEQAEVYNTYGSSETTVCASYMIPEFFVKMPTIPLNANGKPDTARLPVVMKAGRL